MKWQVLSVNIVGTDKVTEVKCSNCGYKVSYHGDKIPKRCLFCKEVPDTPTGREGNKFRFPTID